MYMMYIYIYDICLWCMYIHIWCMYIHAWWMCIFHNIYIYDFFYMIYDVYIHIWHMYICQCKHSLHNVYTYDVCIFIYIWPKIDQLSLLGNVNILYIIYTYMIHITFFKEFYWVFNELITHKWFMRPYFANVSIGTGFEPVMN